MSLSPATRTDLEILRLQGATITDHGDHLVVRSPSQPTFHWGNCVHVTTGDVADAQRWISVFHKEFPTADWLAVGLPQMPVGDGWQQAGLTPESEDVLSLTGLPQLRPLPVGFQVRQFASQADWDAHHAFVRARNDEDRQADPDAYATFDLDRQRARQELAAQGRLGWFGAFTPDGELASTLGIVVLGEGNELARYQAVETAPDHQRKGLASHLLGVAAQWAARRGASRFVIVTESTNPAGRVYRGVGFGPDRPVVDVYRRPEH